MAEVVLSAILPVIFEKLASPLIQKFILSSGVKKGADKLRTTFLSIQAVLEDAEEQQLKNKSIMVWLGKLKEVACDIDDIFDEFSIEDLRRKVEIRGRIVSKVRNFFTLSNPLAFYLRMGCKIREVVDRLDLIAKEKADFNLSEKIVDKQSHSGEQRETYSFVHEAEVYGRNEDREKLVELLINMGNEKEGTENLSIIPIVGIGGLGKTTLAQFIYNDDRVKNHFDQRMWAYVSEDFNLGEIIRAIISSATEDKCDHTSMDVLQSHLRKILFGKKYLLVLDDVWNEDQEKWNNLKSLLRCGDRGSKVIVTTRSEIVASVVGTLPTYYLEALSEDDCWSLFKKRAFPQGDEHAFPNLVTIGKEIVKRCGGVPLAVGALGGLLYYQKREKEWLGVKESEIWKLGEDKIISTLRLSYDHLSSRLKQCFAYCSIFPKGYVFDRFKVIQLWIAEGFIQTSNGSRLAEDIGEEYFDKLCWRSLFQKVETKKIQPSDYLIGAKKDSYDDDRVLFRMHDLVCDLARSIGETECSIIERSSATGVPAQSRHSSYFCNEALSSINPSFVSNARKIHTFILVGYTHRIHSIPGDMLKLIYLRVLDLGSTRIKDLPESIGKLKHLRYLDVSNTLIRKLPESIDTLWNLQTLRLLRCLYLKELPKGMRKMANLRHLLIDKVEKIKCVPSGLGQLSYLQTLPLFIVGKERGCGIGELEGLNLCGRLVIKSLQNVLNRTDAERAGLKEKHNISDLQLSWEDNNDDSINGENENYQHVIERLEPHLNIEKLMIENFKGLKFPTWLMDLRLPNLIVIKLMNCSRCDSLPSFSQLCFLKELWIQGMPNLERWSSAETGQVLRHVEELSIVGCPKLTSLPNLPSLKKLLFKRSNMDLFKFIVDCHSVVLLNIGGFPELTSLPKGLLQNKNLSKGLGISNCPKLKFIPEDLSNVTTIKHLMIEDCDKVVSQENGLQNFISLQTLRICSCDSIQSLPHEEFRRLISLHTLYISDCKNLRSLGDGLQYLTALKHLYVRECPKLVSLSESIQKLLSLRTLCLDQLPELACLPEEFGNLSSLKELILHDCPSILQLPIGLKKATTLHYICIRDCPHLIKRCIRDTGEDWYKIAHVPEIQIDLQFI